MSNRIVAHELRELAALAQVDVETIQHFVVGISGAQRTISFVVPEEHCAVIVVIEEFNADDALGRTTGKGEHGTASSVLVPTDWGIGGDVFYIYPPGEASIRLTATPVGGKTYVARAVGYTLPYSAYARLARMGTRVQS